MEHLADTLRQQTENLPAEQLLAIIVERFGDRVALATSGSAEDQVVTDMLVRIDPKVRIFTLDTGRLPQETYDVIEATYARYGVRIKMLFPDSRQVEAMTSLSGPNLFRHSVEARKRCCYVRKVLPLRGELQTLDAWITGLRREQSVTRQDLRRVEWDEGNGRIKINPLADWTAGQVADYVIRHDVPISPLHEQGYPSIGCACCTRAVKPGEDQRAGRWWWEQPEHKECGLHVVDGQLVKARR